MLCYYIRDCTDFREFFKLSGTEPARWALKSYAEIPVLYTRINAHRPYTHTRRRKR